MHVRLRWTLLILSAAIVAFALLEPWAPAPGVSDGGASEARKDAGAAQVREPTLETLGAVRPDEHAGSAAAEPPADLWTVEVTEVVGPDGRALPDAEVYLDQVRTVNRTWTWSGEPVRIHLRPWADDGTRREENEREDYVACDDTPVYISVRHEKYATWFAPALRHGERKKTVLRAVLGKRRTLRGTVLAHDGRRAPVSDLEVVVRPRHVPEKLGGIAATLDGEGRFVLDNDEAVPAGPLVITARCEEEFVDGMPVTAELGPRDEEAVLVLRTAHKFRLHVRIDDDAEGTRGVWRRVVLRGPSTRDAAFPSDGMFEVGAEPEHKPYTDVLLPEGGTEVWHVRAIGYERANVELRAVGTAREHDVAVRLQPALQSGLLALDATGSAAALQSSMDLRFTDPGGPRDIFACARWNLTPGTRTRVTVRLPSGVRRKVHLSRARTGNKSWVLSPFELALNSGQRVEREVRILQAAVLRVARKREGGLMPGLHIRLTQGTVTRLWTRWLNTRDKDGTRAYLQLGEVEPGAWTIELLRDGKLLPWSKRIRVEAGEDVEIHIPDEVVLPEG